MEKQARAEEREPGKGASPSALFKTVQPHAGVSLQATGMKRKEDADNVEERIARMECMVEQLQKDVDQSQAGPGSAGRLRSSSISGSGANLLCQEEDHNAEARIARIERMVEQLQKDADHQKDINERVIDAMMTEAPAQPATPPKAKPTDLRLVRNSESS